MMGAAFDPPLRQHDHRVTGTRTADLKILPGS